MSAIAQQEKTALVGVPEAAKRIGLHEGTLRKYIDNGKIPGMRFGRSYKVPNWWIEEQLNGPRSLEAAQ